MAHGQCTARGCTKAAHSRGLCGTHYQRLRTTGSIQENRPVGLGRNFAWLISHCQPDHDECVIWPHYIGPQGYGAFGLNGTTAGAHREACRIEHGDPPSPHHEAAHSCGNRACVNGRHLRWATPAENAADRIIHGTHREGEMAGPAKLTNIQAAMIREDRRKQREIAADFGVTQKVVCMIKQGRTYKAALGMV